MTNILDLTLREILEKFCILYSPECGYYYGITTWDNILRLNLEYDLTDCVSIDADSFVNDEINLNKLLDYEKLKEIAENNGLNKKE